MIEITPSIQIDEQELDFVFIRSPGPGGQNVNKVSSAVQLRFNARESPALPQEVKQRLFKLAGRRLTSEGILIIEARQYRSQEQNRQAAKERLRRLIQQAAVPPKPRRKTRPTRASILLRLEAKRKRSKIKRMRRDAGIDG
jgi:ribosome-associated protein